MTGAGIGSGSSGLGNSKNIHALLQRKDTDMTGSTGFSSIGRLFNYFTNESQILCFKIFSQLEVVRSAWNLILLVRFVGQALLF